MDREHGLHQAWKYTRNSRTTLLAPIHAVDRSREGGIHVGRFRNIQIRLHLCRQSRGHRCRTAANSDILLEAMTKPNLGANKGTEEA